MIKEKDLLSMIWQEVQTLEDSLSSNFKNTIGTLNEFTKVTDNWFIVDK